MLAIICDQTGLTELVPGSQIEVREGKKPGEWVWVIKGIEKLTNFTPRPYVSELDLMLSKQALIDWKEQSDILDSEAVAEKQAIVETLKASAESIKENIMQLDVTKTTNMTPK